MTIINDYLSYTKQYSETYGEKTLVLIQVGSFFECYALVKKDGTYHGSHIRQFAEINDMTISRKNICVSGQSVVMAGFGVPQLEKYVRKMQDHGYTIVVFTQDNPSKNTTRSLSCIYSPGTFFSNESSCLDAELSNNTTCIWIHYSSKNRSIKEMLTIGIANIDIYTGKTSINEFQTEYYHNPTTYDELEKFVSIYKPNETIIISNLSREIIENIIQFVNIMSRQTHIIELGDSSESSELQKEALNSERQNYQQQIFKKFFGIARGRNENFDSDKENEIIATYYDYCIATQSFCFLLEFIYKHNPNLVNKIEKPIIENLGDRLILANHSLKQLNIISDNRYIGKLGSVATLLNNAVTIMGRRRFNYNLLNPGTNVDLLNKSYDITEHFLKENNWDYIRNQLANIKDFERIKRKLIMNKITPRDFYNLYQNLSTLQDLYRKLRKDKTFINYISGYIQEDLIESTTTIVQFIKTHFSLERAKYIDDLSTDKLNNYSVENVQFINRGVSEELDRKTKTCIDSREVLETIRSWLSLQLEEYEKSGRSNKSGKTNEYIKIHETPKAEPMLIGTKRRVTILKTVIDKLRQDPKNPTGEILLNYKSKYSNTEESYTLSLNALEYKPHGGNQSNLVVTSPLIHKLTNYIQSSRDYLTTEIQNTYYQITQNFITTIEINGINILDDIINFTSECDLIQCRCYIAKKYNYCKPVIMKADKSFVDFKQIRHPLIEQLNQRELYVTNDFVLGLETGGESDPNGLLLYGTNAVGKTSFIKSIGISTIMAQAGLYVPCSSFTYWPYNYIFTRILGNDNIFKGLSTFAVEMSELRTILKQSNRNSLILGDELCSGTESTSALSIFTAGLERLHEIEASFIFATHYHEIVKYKEIQDLRRLKLCHMSVLFDREAGKLIYDRKLREGPGENMYGLEVCKSLDLPYNFLDRAHELRMKYSSQPVVQVLKTKASRYNKKKLRDMCEICNTEMSTEVHHLQHQKNADTGGIIGGEFHKNHKANLINICESCHSKIHERDVEHRIVKTSDGYEILEIRS